jgi:alkanesulfonate monooxygenase SsuD/methylene tetrahydromethanopterin reductase-like flavin-dependent oxidoreductase (luciferase family)
MKFGIISLGDNLPDPVTGRLPSAVEHHREILELADKAEALGFDSFHVGEHHSCHYITSTPSVVLGAISARTERIVLSTATALLPVHDPVKFAEDYATVDVLSNGRAEVIVSRGILARSYGDLGYDYASSRAIFKENIELVLQLWREENVTWEGEFRTPIDGYTVQPRPVQKPNPPLWIGGGFSEESILLAAELGLPLMIPSVIMPPTHFAEMVDQYRQTFQDRGFGGPSVGALSHTHCAKDLDVVRERYAPRHSAYMNWVGQELIPWALAPVLPPGTDPPNMPPIDFEQARVDGPIVAGSPQQVLDRLGEFKEALDLDRHLLHVDSGTQPQEAIFESLDLLATEVLPKLDWR